MFGLALKYWISHERVGEHRQYQVGWAIRRIAQGGVVTTFAGTPGTFGNADGTGPKASFHDLRRPDHERRMGFESV